MERGSAEFAARAEQGREESEKKDQFFIGQESYEGDQSPRFDELLRSRKHLDAIRGHNTEPTKEDLLVSEWQAPCHVIITRDANGDCQAFHVQPNTGEGSLLTYEQVQALRQPRNKGASAIAASGRRGWFRFDDVRELESMGIKHERTINVDTSNWWRLLYDPTVNEIWIDVKEKKLLLKYRGFGGSGE